MLYSCRFFGLDATVDPGACGYSDLDSTSFGPGFNNAGGGVFALQFAADGIKTWFWTAANVPAGALFLAFPSSNQRMTDWDFRHQESLADAEHLGRFRRALQHPGIELLARDVLQRPAPRGEYQPRGVVAAGCLGNKYTACLQFLFN